MRPTLGACVPSVVRAFWLAHMIVLACFYLFHGKLHFIQVVFVMCTLWVLRVGLKAPVALPRVKGYVAYNTKATLLVLLVLDDANAIGRCSA